MNHHRQNFLDHEQAAQSKILRAAMLLEPSNALATNDPHAAKASAIVLVGLALLDLAKSDPDEKAYALAEQWIQRQRSKAEIHESSI